MPGSVSGSIEGFEEWMNGLGRYDQSVVNHVVAEVACFVEDELGARMEDRGDHVAAPITDRTAIEIVEGIRRRKWAWL